METRRKQRTSSGRRY